ncbi:MAG: TonB-dependent receptor [Planctomycetota bacterium]
MLLSAPLIAQQGGTVLGNIQDGDFGGTVPGVQVTIRGTKPQLKAESDEFGNYQITDVPAGTYTVVFSKDGFLQTAVEILVRSGGLAEQDIALYGDFNDLDEVVVQDLLGSGTGTEASLLQLRFESPALIDSVSNELMSQAGAGDAASALKLVSGATIQNGKFAVIRGLPDRYVSSQVNGVRLPSSDEDKRAVELDQFPSAIIESLQVSKTFTPDQQGDASGGAVNVVLKSLPDEAVLRYSAQVSANSQAAFRDDFLSYADGGVGLFGVGEGNDPQELGQNWTGAVGVEETQSPIDFKLNSTYGDRWETEEGTVFGGLLNLFYERDSSYFDNGQENNLFVDLPGEELSPVLSQVQGSDEFYTALYDLTRASQLVQWGGLLSLGMETDNHTLGLAALYTRTTEDRATLAENTRGKELFFPGYDPDDVDDPGNDPENILVSPYLRTQALEYTEREATTIQLSGSHYFESAGEFNLGDSFAFRQPELNWVASYSTASLDQPDRRLFGSVFVPANFEPPNPFGGGGELNPPSYAPFKPAANFNLGNVQRIFKTIDEESVQFSADVKWPFQQWDGYEGYLKFGVFDDSVEREFRMQTFSNFGDQSGASNLNFDQFWSSIFPEEDHPITGTETDADYDGTIDISAAYLMADLPLSSVFKLIGGVRFESTDISTKVDAEADVNYFPPLEDQPPSQIDLGINPTAADAQFSDDNILPALGFSWELSDKVTFRGSYSQTLARQTFKELTPVIQQEFLGGPIFVGNNKLRTSQLDNYDARFDYRPYDGGLFSVSFFLKNVTDPIEFIQRQVVLFDFTSVANYPKGKLSGVELETRQDLGRFWREARGITVGANATFIRSRVDLPQEEIDNFIDFTDTAGNTVDYVITSRDMVFAPEYLYNLFLTYELEDLDAELGIFYTLTGDTLLEGATAEAENFVPNVYAEEFGTLNLSYQQRLSDGVVLRIQAKNITNPDIDTVYRFDQFETNNQIKSTFSRGVEFSMGVSVTL